MSARKDKQRALMALERAKKALPKPRVYKHTHIAPHMIDLPLAAALIDSVQRDDVPQYFGTAKDIINHLTKQTSWPSSDIQFLIGDNIENIRSSKLVLCAEIALSENIKWANSRLAIKNIPIPETVIASLIGKSIRRLIEHPWLHESMKIKSIYKWPKKPISDDADMITIDFINHQPAIKYALKLLGANQPEN